MSEVSPRPLVVVDNVTRTFIHEGNQLTVLKGISLEVEAGEMVSIVGASGTGKSTLLHLLGTLDLPTSGRILYDGVDVTKLPDQKLAEFRNRSIGFVFQFHHLLPEFTALENVMMPGYIRGTPRAELEKRASDLLDEVGLSHRRQHRPSELSGGEQARVAVARALVMEPRVVLADEPTGNLDTKTSDAVHQLLFDLNRQRGTTFLVVTHNRELAARMPRIIAMKDGLIESDERHERTDDRLPHASSETREPDPSTPGNDGPKIDTGDTAEA